MGSRVQLKDKKKFIKWFLENYQLKRRESLWIMNYLLNHDIVLNKTKFIEKAHATPRGILMSTVGMNESDFQFYKDGIGFKDPEKAFHEVRLNWHSDLYLELIFPESFLSKRYLEVVEDNPYAPWNDTVPEELDNHVENELDRMQLEERKEELLKEIDAALVSNEKNNFYDLTDELNEIDEYLDKKLSNKK